MFDLFQMGNSFERTTKFRSRDDVNDATNESDDVTYDVRIESFSDFSTRRSRRIHNHVRRRQNLLRNL